ncbi:hypothetical protein LUW77_26730 [Streptomyces radiopugnans]|nr:hypothetical protein LUW77_26730 [Streptomyces radiopugnans]
MSRRRGVIRCEWVPGHSSSSAPRTRSVVTGAAARAKWYGTATAVRG